MASPLAWLEGKDQGKLAPGAELLRVQEEAGQGRSTGLHGVPSGQRDAKQDRAHLL